MFPAFEVVPAVDLRGGDVVQLVGGEPGTGAAYGNPITVAQRWVEEGADTLHIVDLDGAIDGERRNADAITTIAETVDATLQVGGGVRSVEAAATLLDAGIDRVVLGTAAIEDPTIVSTIADRYPDGVVVSLDASAGDVLVEGWTEATGIDPVTAADRFADRGAAGILFTDVDVEGRRAGVRTHDLAAMVDTVSIPVIASGGVGSIEDVLAVHDVGAAACVVGTALYEEVFSLADVMRALGQRE